MEEKRTGPFSRPETVTLEEGKNQGYCWRLSEDHGIWWWAWWCAGKAPDQRMFVTAHSRIPANLLSQLGGASCQRFSLHLVPCRTQMSHEGAAFCFLMRNLTVIALMITVTLSDDLVIVVAPFDQRNRAFKDRLGSLL